MDKRDQKDRIKAERAALDSLLDKGLEFKIERKPLFGFIKRKPRIIRINQPFLGTLDHLSRELLDMEIDEEKIKAAPIQESRRLALLNARRAARVVAIAYLNSKWGIRFLAGVYTRYFLWRITPSKLYQLAMIISTISNVADFTNSIRLLSVARTTEPKADRVE